MFSKLAYEIFDLAFVVVVIYKNSFRN